MAFKKKTIKTSEVLKKPVIIRPFKSKTAKKIISTEKAETPSEHVSTLKIQHGGDHYQNKSIQPIEYSHANKLGAHEHSVLKYITRHRDVNGGEGALDIKKSIHFLQMLLEMEYGIMSTVEFSPEK